MKSLFRMVQTSRSTTSGLPLMTRIFMGTKVRFLSNICNSHPVNGEHHSKSAKTVEWI
jgi:hypothetical protein